MCINLISKVKEKKSRVNIYTVNVGTYVSSLIRVTHSSAFIFSRASSRAENDVATRRLGWKPLYLCF